MTSPKSRIAGSLLVLLILPLISANALGAAQSDPLSADVLHGTLELEYVRNEHVVFLLDRKLSRFTGPDGQPDVAIRFAPKEWQRLHNQLPTARTTFENTTIDRRTNGVRLTLPGHGSLVLAVPQRRSDASTPTDRTTDQLVLGKALGWEDIRNEYATFPNALADLRTRNLVGCGNRDSAQPEGAKTAGTDIDCTTGGPGAKSCSVSCPLDLGGCTVTCMYGYYACCSCYTGCVCKREGIDTDPY